MLNIQGLYCQNLSLLSKLFLDQKTLFYDISLFLFYTLYSKSTILGYDPTFVGYFSKEKVSVENYNLACVLTFPQYRGQHYGTLLVELSYEISKLKKVVGSPEKPLSTQGLSVYKTYWRSSILLNLLQKSKQPTPPQTSKSTSSDLVSTKLSLNDQSSPLPETTALETFLVFSISELSAETAITVPDILATLDDLNLLSKWHDEHTVYLTFNFLLDTIKRLNISFKKRLDPSGVIAENLY
ncbi:hypothetical protein BB560_006637 [Smittium megazygosporum]|uniref:histone acetyltransferase n=1 Tax=Smittium megazygosporum TaxID=133381 RepID=A0A2T9Y2P6_9FUNG|nr:hypothetical protein BB560_006637 [Smittium megazygosporum]